VSNDRIADRQYVDIDSLGPLETVDCLLCDGSQTRTITSQKWFGDEFFIVRCAKCNLMFTNPRPSPEWKSHFYDPRHNPMMEDLKRDFIYEPYEDRVLAYARLCEFIKSNVGAGNKLLDIGCGVGRFVKMALEQGFNATGIDRAPGALAYAEKYYGLRLIQGEAESIPVPDKTYDIVTLIHVIEHSRNPLSVLREVRRVLKPGGILFIETPNSLRFYLIERYLPLFKMAYLKVQNKAWSKCKWGHVPWFPLDDIPWFPFDHYYHWTSDTLLTVLRKSGFKQFRIHVLDNYSPSMPLNGHFSIYHKVHIKIIKSLYSITSQRLNMWGILFATVKAP